MFLLLSRFALGFLASSSLFYKMFLYFAQSLDRSFAHV